MRPPELLPPQEALGYRGAATHPAFERRLSGASPQRRPLRSSPLAGPALSDNTHPHRTSSNPDLTSFYTRLLPRNRSYHDLPPPLSPSSRSFQHTHYSNASSSTLASGSTRKKLTKRFSSQPPPSSANRRMSYETSLSHLPPAPTTRIGNIEGVDKISTFTASEAPRFTRTALKNRNVVMPLSAKEYQHKRRETAISFSPSLVSLHQQPVITRPQPTLLAPESRRRGRSFTQEECDAFGRYHRDLAGRNPDDPSADDAASADLPSPPRMPSPTRSSSTDSTIDSTACHTPFASSSMSSTSSSSLPTISEPYTPQSPSFPHYTVSLVGHSKPTPEKVPSRSPSMLSFRHLFQPYHSDDGSSYAWSDSGEGSRDGSTTCEGSVQSTTPRSHKSLPTPADSPPPGKSRSPFKRLLRTFTSSKRHPANTNSAATPTHSGHCS